MNMMERGTGRGRHRGRGRGRINHKYYPPNPTTQASSSNAQFPHKTQSTNNPASYARISTQKSNTAAAAPDDDKQEDNHPAVIGTCPLMCPEKEREQRERLRDLAVFERLNGNPSKSSPGLAVKKFCRTISVKHGQASIVRPLSVLNKTLNHLLKLLDSREHPFEVVHDFIFDRTRSIRQDLSMQNIGGDQVIHMYERMVKFHIISDHKLRTCGGSPNSSSIQHLNMEQLTKTLISLFDLYKDNQTSQSIHENEAEFYSLYVLLHLGSDIPAMGLSLSSWFRHVPSPIIKSKEMCFARRVLRYFRLCNYKCFIRTIENEASDLQYCIVEPYINEVRALAVSCVNYGGYKLHPYPLSDLAKLLMMKESDVESFCQDCGLEISTDEVGRKFLPTKQTSFSNPRRWSEDYSRLDSERLNRLITIVGKE